MILAQLEIPLEALEALAAFAHKHKIPFMLDPAPARELPASLLASVTWITPNESETRILCGPGREGTCHSEHGCPLRRVAAGAGAAKCNYQNGRAGGFSGHCRGRLSNGRRFPMTAVDSTAAGDAFNAGFAVSLLEGKNALAAARYAAAVAAISVTRKGAQPSMPTAREVKAFLQVAGKS